MDPTASWQRSSVTGTASTRALWLACASALLPAFVSLALLGRTQGSDWSSGPRFGYTLALSIFVVPLFMHGWHAARSSGGIGALWTPSFRKTIATTFVIGFVLDVVFGGFFLTFPSSRGVLGATLPGYRPGVGFVSYIPVEEFAFYVLGMMWIVSNYAFVDRFVAPMHRRSEPRSLRSLISPSAGWASALTIAAVLAAVVYFGGSSSTSSDRSAVPGYAWFILLTTGTPPLLLSRRVGRRINPVALAVTFVLCTITSIIWEPSLGLPLGWWGYNPRYMCGLKIDGWFALPIEAVGFWWASVGTGALVFETVRAMLGEPTSTHRNESTEVS
jgi:hypothetical protein